MDKLETMMAGDTKKSIRSTRGSGSGHRMHAVDGCPANMAMMWAARCLYIEARNEKWDIGP
jgi:hypothetical protein